MNRRHQNARVTPAQLAAAAPAAVVKSPPAHPAGAVDHKTAAELLITTQRTQEDVAGAVAQLVALVDRRPAQLRDVVLSAAQPQRRVMGESALSFGIYNPTPAVIYSSVTGLAAAPAMGALSFPAKSLVVLPLAVESELVIGAAPADVAAADLAVFVLLFSTVQAASMETLS